MSEHKSTKPSVCNMTRAKTFSTQAQLRGVFPIMVLLAC